MKVIDILSDIKVRYPHEFTDQQVFAWIDHAQYEMCRVVPMDVVKILSVNDELDMPREYIELLKISVFITIARAGGEVALANNYVRDYNRLIEEFRGDKYKKGDGYPVVKVINK